MTSLYRTHRPTTFSGVIGQEHVVRTLRNAIEQGRIGHAYLFAGPRGTGKTSLAKIFAKALNCERSDGPTASPCGECETCVAIHRGQALDVTELDAASNRGIDDVQQIREHAAYVPATGRRRVYILDEAHSLTADASNALLKTLEEPPPHVVFILCTTEASKLLPTIRSRCQRFLFRRPGPAELVAVLGAVCELEGIAASDEALRLIARAGGGAFRDALTTLDQVRAVAGGDAIDGDAVRAALGVVGEGTLGEVVDALARGDAGSLLGLIESLSGAGESLDVLTRALLDHLRLLYLLQHTGELPASEATTDDRLGELRRQAEAFAPTEVLRTVDLLGRALEEVRDGSEPRLPLEVALMKAARPQVEPGMGALLARVERIEHGLASGEPASGEPPAPQSDARPPLAVVADPPPGALASAELPDIVAAWPNVIASAQGQLRGVLERSAPVALEGGVLTVEVVEGLLLHATRQAQEIAGLLVDAAAVRYELRFVPRPRRDEAAAPAPAVEDAPQPGGGDDLAAQFRQRLDATEVDA